MLGVRGIFEIHLDISLMILGRFLGTSLYYCYTMEKSRLPVLVYTERKSVFLSWWPWSPFLEATQLLALVRLPPVGAVADELRMAVEGGAGLFLFFHSGANSGRH